MAAEISVKRPGVDTGFEGFIERIFSREARLNYSMEQAASALAADPESGSEREIVSMITDNFPDNTFALLNAYYAAGLNEKIPGLAQSRSGVREFRAIQDLVAGLETNERFVHSEVVRRIRGASSAKDLTEYVGKFGFDEHPMFKIMAETRLKELSPDAPAGN